MNTRYRYLVLMLLPLMSLLAVSCEKESEPVAEPQITSIYPAASTPGSLIALIGLNVKDASAVTFGSVEAAIITDTANAVLVNVPTGIDLGNVVVTVNAPGGAYSYPFNVLNPATSATFTGITPATGAVGTEVEITGTNFTGATSLKVGSTAIEQFQVNDAGNKISFTVPRSAYFNPFSGTFSVTTPAGTFYSPVNVAFKLQQTAKVLVSLTADDVFVLQGFPETVELTANLSGKDEDLAKVGKVVFMNGNTVLAESTVAPFIYELEVGAAEAFTNYAVTALAYDKDGKLIMDSEVVTVRVGKRIPVGGGTLTGDGNERWNTDGPKTPPFPADGMYAGFLNFNGAGNLEVASGVNVQVTVPEAGKYIAALGLASGWAEAESFMWLYFNDGKDAAQRSPEVPPTGWIDFADYFIANPFTLESGVQTAKIRFGGPFVHPYYLDLYKF